MAKIASAVKLIQEQKKKLIKEILNSDIQLCGKTFAILSKVIDYISHAGNTASAAELIPAVSTVLSEGTLLAATSWTFGDGLPGSSPTILRKIRSGPYVNQRSNEPDYHQAWMEVRRTTVASLQDMANRSNLSKDILQILFKAIGNNDRQNLRLQFLKGYESHITALDKKI